MMTISILFDITEKNLMKCFYVLFLLFSNILLGQVGVGTITPSPSAILDITSNDKGVLPPRVSLASITTDRLDGVNLAEEGLLIYNTNAGTTGGSGKGFYYFNGTFWEPVGKDDFDWQGGETSLDDDITTRGQVNINRSASGKASLKIGTDAVDGIADGSISIGPYSAMTATTKFAIGRDRVATAFDSIFTCGGITCGWTVFATEFSNRNAFDISNIGEVRINESYALPLGDGNAGEVLTTDGNGQTSWQPIPTNFNRNSLQNQQPLISRIILTENQLITSGTDERLAFNSIQFSTKELLDSSRNKLIIGDSGIYKLNCSLQITPESSSSSLKVFVRRNDEDYQINTFKDVSSNHGIIIESLIQCNSGDVIELFIQTTSGESLVIEKAESYLSLEQLTSKV